MIKKTSTKINQMPENCKMFEKMLKNDRKPIIVEK